MNPLAPYFEMEDQGTHFKFTPTESYERLCKVTNPKSKKHDYFVFVKETDCVKISMNKEETKSITPFWKFRDGKWIIMAQSSYRRDFFDQHNLEFAKLKADEILARLSEVFHEAYGGAWSQEEENFHWHIEDLIREALGVKS